jgi:hypothetical protein
MNDTRVAIESLERGREKNTERATDLLFRYVTGAHPSLLRDANTRQDTRAELHECVEAIVDAAAFAVRRSYLSAKPEPKPVPSDRVWRNLDPDSDNFAPDPEVLP